MESHGGECRCSEADKWRKATRQMRNNFRICCAERPVPPVRQSAVVGVEAHVPGDRLMQALRRQYKRDSGRVVTITVVGGRFASIEESQAYLGKVALMPFEARAARPMFKTSSRQGEVMRVRRIVVFIALGTAFVLCTAAQAVSTLRVGNQVLTAGDSEVRVTELLGKPSHKSRSRSSRSSHSHGGRRRHGSVLVLSNDSVGEKWQYRRDDHVTTVTIVDGKVSDIEDRRL